MVVGVDKFFKCGGEWEWTFYYMHPLHHIQNIGNNRKLWTKSLLLKINHFVNYWSFINIASKFVQRVLYTKQTSCISVESIY